MEVVGVIGVAARPEHRVELGASPGKGRLEEGPRRRRPSPPMAQYVDLSPVGEAEGRDIQRIAEGMLGHRLAAAIAGAAAVRGDLADFHHPAAEIGAGRRLY